MDYPNILSHTVEAIDSPALLVFPRIIKENITMAQLMVNSSGSLRPHVKTVKCLEIINLAKEKGIKKFKCSTIAEAELLGISKAENVLLNYQLSLTKAKRFRELRIAYPRTTFSCLIDNIKSTKGLSEIFKKSCVNVYIDVNLGMDRTGIHPEDALDLLMDVESLKEIHVVGFHAYEGHVDSSHKKVRLKQASEACNEMMTLKSRGSQILKRELSVVLGGSPNFEYYADQDNVECSPGTFFLWDYGYSKAYPEIPFKVAAVLLTRVISIIDDKKLCLDLGYKAVASDQALPRLIFPDIKEYVVLSQYEEHMVVQVPDTSVYQVGTPWFAIPFHICPTVNLYEKVIAVEDERISDHWKITARDRHITI